MPTPHHSIFYKPDALPDDEPTASKTEGYKHANIVICIS